MTGAREMSESALLIAIAAVIVLRLRPRPAIGVLGAGIVIGTVASVAAVAILLATDSRLGRTGEDAFEAASMVASALLLVWVTRYVAGAADVSRPPAGRPEVPLAALAVVTVIREAPETAIEIADSTELSVAGALAAGLAGVLLVVVVAWVLVALALRTPWRGTWAAILAANVLVGAALASHAMSELASAGLVESGWRLWDLEAILPHDHGFGRWLRIFTGYSAQLTALELIVWVGYIVTAGLTGLRSAGTLRRP